MASSKVKSESQKESFEEKLKAFIYELENTSIPDYFNPWQSSSLDRDKDEAKIRRDNLKNFLRERKDTVKYVLIGEAPSLGARFTGIPMVCEAILKEDIYKNIFKNIKTTSKNDDTEEVTSKIVWYSIVKNKLDEKQFAIWNAFAFNKDETGKYPKPTIEDLTNNSNAELLRMFLDLFPDAKIIAVGKTSYGMLGYLNSEYIRHPSYGGKNKFIEDFLKKIEVNDV